MRGEVERVDKKDETNPMDNPINREILKRTEEEKRRQYQALFGDGGVE